MKIALITEYLKPQKNGIAVRFSEITNRIKKFEDCDVTVYGPKSHAVDHELITFKNKWNKDNFFCFPTLKLLRDVMVEKYDIVFFVLPPFFAWSLIGFVAKLTGSKIIVSNHVNSSYYKKSYSKNKTLYNILYALYKTTVLKPQKYLCDLILAPSHIEELNVNGVKTGIIKSGVNFDNFPAVIQKQKNYNVVFVGRLAPEKNLEKLIDLFMKLDTNQFNLTIIGDGSFASVLKNKYSKISNIRFLGYVKHEDLHKHYHNADFHLITSESETFGFTPVESMACGTPVIYPNRHPFNKLYLKEFPDLMYELNCEESFLKSVNALYQNYDFYVKKSSEFVRENFSWENAMEDLINQFKVLLN
jgi:glycosyltransferase involved in cell wall biosynthesis